MQVVFGAGQVGSRLAARLANAGHRVRVVRRSSAQAAPGTEVRQGDAANCAFCVEAAPTVGEEAARATVAWARAIYAPVRA